MFSAAPGFSELELDQLKQELNHHQEKVDQFEQLSGQLYSDSEYALNSPLPVPLNPLLPEPMDGVVVEYFSTITRISLIALPQV